MPVHVRLGVDNSAYVYLKLPPMTKRNDKGLNNNGQILKSAGHIHYLAEQPILYTAEGLMSLLIVFMICNVRVLSEVIDPGE